MATSPHQLPAKDSSLSYLCSSPCSHNTISSCKRSSTLLPSQWPGPPQGRVPVLVPKWLVLGLRDITQARHGSPAAC